jgi:hypothetical protein
LSQIIRGILRSLYGEDCILAADIHYALDYIDTWLDPEKTKNMLENIKNRLLLTRNRYGFVDLIRRLLGGCLGLRKKPNLSLIKEKLSIFEF